ncbi:MAG: GIY-YIG nuclease family protein [Lysobacteraceae bacterium]
MADMDDDALLDALGVEVAPLKAHTRTPREERIIAGFEDILRFHATHGRVPQHGRERDIFERIYAVRLDRLRQLPEASALLAELDVPGMLVAAQATDADTPLDDDDLLAELGAGMDIANPDDITVLRHVRSHAQVKAAEEIAERTPCEEFERFAPQFEQVERELRDGARKTVPFKDEVSVEVGNWFIVGGQLAYVAEKGEEFQASSRQPDARLRLIYANGTESNLLMRSLQRALTQDRNGRRVTALHLGPLFGDSAEPDDIASGTIYVLRSHSDHPFVAQHRELIHKIGVTGGKVTERIAGAAHDATYLLAEVEVVAEYALHNIQRSKLENLFHRLFAPAQMDLNLKDRFGKPVKPREWFLVPLHVIDQAVDRIRDGSISDYRYDPAAARLVEVGDGDHPVA